MSILGSCVVKTQRPKDLEVLQMKTYTNKSNAKRTAVKAVAAERNIDISEVKANEAQYFTIEGDKENGFYPHYLTERVGVSAAREEQLAAERKLDKEFIALCGHSHCPHCNIHLDNGLQDFDNMLESHKDQKEVEPITHEWLCLGCGEEFGEVRELPVAGAGIKIEKDRPEQNGIIRPSAGGKCRAIWDYCDSFYASGAIPMPKQMKAAARENGWNENNSIIEMYQWRKFTGLTGRQK